MAELYSAPQFLTIEKWLFEQIIQHGQRWRSIVVTVKQLRELWKSEFLPAIKSEIEAVKEARESFYVEGRLVPSKYNPTRDQRAALRGFQPASISSCKQQWRRQLQ